VPTPFSKRVLNEYCVSFSVPLSVEMLPLPLFKSPDQTADALRFIISFQWPKREFASAGATLMRVSAKFKSASFVDRELGWLSVGPA
jgi:hypothetical protein